MNFYISVVLISSSEVFLLFQRLLRIRKIEFFDDRGPAKITIFAYFSILHILPQNEWIFTFQLSWAQAAKFSFRFKDFPESEKLKISMTTDLRKMTFLISQFCPKMIEFLYFSCPDVR